MRNIIKSKIIFTTIVAFSKLISINSQLNTYNKVEKSLIFFKSFKTSNNFKPIDSKQKHKKINDINSDTNYT
jgi:hypothetical protein